LGRTDLNQLLAMIEAFARRWPINPTYQLWNWTLTDFGGSSQWRM